MSNLPDLAECVASFLSDKEKEMTVRGEGAAYEEDDPGFTTRDINHRFDRIHPDVRPYAMMTKTCFMPFDPMSDRGQLPSIYARPIAPYIGNKIFLQDKNLNQIQVAVEQDRQDIYFTHGWIRIRDFYNITSGAWLVLVFVNPFLFRLSVRDMAGVEVEYPLNDPPTKLLLDNNIDTVSLKAPIPYFILPKSFTHMLEKTLTAFDVSSGSLTIFWGGFCQSALPNEEVDLTFIDWLGNTWNKCHLQFQNITNMTCTISGDWEDICRVHRLAEGVIVKLGVTKAANNRTLYFKLAPFIGVKTTYYAPSTSGRRKLFYQSHEYYML